MFGMKSSSSNPSNQVCIL